MKLFHKIYPNENATEYLFILHGLFGMLDNWHHMARKLSEHFTVITVDQRNHGKSPHSEEMSFEIMANDLALLMTHLDIEKAHVLGHSMGGKTAMKFADLHPDKLSKLIVVDIAPRKYKPGHLTYFQAFKTIDFSQFETRKEADQALSEIEENIGIRQFLLKNLEKSDPGYQLKFNLKPIETFYPKMIDTMEFQWLINAPTLFLYGGKSGYITEEDKLSIEDTFTEVEFKEIADAGHWVHAEKPIPFFEAVFIFLH
ncbi:MAG: alpha/beta hydrolase [Bacteroidetes bacterium]|nr:MAG: alpha/beta hydrolase [Bacteroidota bacterium]